MERIPLFGREEEIARLLAELGKGSRLLTLTGPSGMGKTRLAARIARDAAPRFGSGSCMARLASCRSESDVQGVVAEALGIVHRQGLDLASSIADRGPFLLVLDNLEHLVGEAAPLIETWLDHAPHLQILATSIVPLGIEGEMRYELGPLGVEDAISLYLDRARHAAADREVAEGERSTIRELVCRLDRLPLAIELAAARIRVLPPRHLLSRISDRFDLLRSSERGRHASLWEALALSWDHLSESERLTLARASVFERGFDWEAAGSLLLPGGSGPVAVLGLVDGLRAKALLQLDEEDDPPRFSLYESVRAFASRKLQEMGLLEETLRRHAAYYVARAELESERCHGPDAPQAIRWLLAERENLLAAQRRLASTDPALASRAGTSLAEVLALNGPASLELEVLGNSIRLAKLASDPLLAGKALWRRARAHKRLASLSEGLADVEEGLRLARQEGDRLLEGRLLLESGAILAVSGEHGPALEDLALAREIGERAQVPEFEGIAWVIVGVVEENRGNQAEAYEAFTRSLAIFRAIGHLRYQGVSLLNLGAICSHQGRFIESRRHLKESREIFRLLENPASEANVILNLGGVAQSEGSLEEARGWLEETLLLERQLGNPRVRGLALAGLALVSLETDCATEAAERLEEAMAVLRPLQEWRHVSTYLPFHAVAKAKIRKFADARSDLSKAREAFERVNDETSLQTVALLEAVVELDEARAVNSAVDTEAWRARLDALLALPHSFARSTEQTFAARRLVSRARAELDEAIPSGAGLLVGAGAGWFQWGGARVDLRRRTAIRRMLLALVEARLDSPGVGLSQESLVEVGWPGERILPEAAATRVYSGIRTLRSLGLAPILLRHAEGYLLDPEVPVAWSR